MPIKKAKQVVVPEPKLKWEVGTEPIRMAVFENYRAVIQSTPRKSYHWTITRLTIGSGRGKIEEIHFRSVTGPLPNFKETFPDEGYLDMYQVMKALRVVKFNGMLVPDHVPPLVGDSGIRRAGTAYAIAAIRALLRRANEEVG